MRPMTARDALIMERTSAPALFLDAGSAHARRILDALVELREASLAYGGSFTDEAETKLAALERGEEPKTATRALKTPEPEEFDPACVVCSRPTHRNAEMCINCEMDNEVQSDLDGLMGG